MNAVANTEAPAAPAPLPAPIRTAEESAFAVAVRKARALTSSTLVPADYRGEDNLGNAMIALEVAERTGASPLMVMQSLYVVHGRPSWSASFLIATVNACGRFSPLRFETVGEDPHDKAYRVRAHAKDKETGEVCEGPWITWKMVDGEGWASKSGSKWKTIPALMFMYRAAAFWTRVYAPELSLGIQTAEEVVDVHEARTVSGGGRTDLSEFQDRLKARALEHDAPATDTEDAPAEPGVDTSTGEITESADAVKAAIASATTRDDLDEAANRISLVPKEYRAALTEQYQAALAALQ